MMITCPRLWVFQWYYFMSIFLKSSSIIMDVREQVMKINFTKSNKNNRYWRNIDNYPVLLGYELYEIYSINISTDPHGIHHPKKFICIPLPYRIIGKIILCITGQRRHNDGVPWYRYSNLKDKNTISHRLYLGDHGVLDKSISGTLSLWRSLYSYMKRE